MKNTCVHGLTWNALAFETSFQSTSRHREEEISRFPILFYWFVSFFKFVAIHEINEMHFHHLERGAGLLKKIGIRQKYALHELESLSTILMNAAVKSQTREEEIICRF